MGEAKGACKGASRLRFIYPLSLCSASPDLTHPRALFYLLFATPQSSRFRTNKCSIRMRNYTPNFSILPISSTGRRLLLVPIKVCGCLLYEVIKLEISFRLTDLVMTIVRAPANAALLRSLTVYVDKYLDQCGRQRICRRFLGRWKSKWLAGEYYKIELRVKKFDLTSRRRHRTCIPDFLRIHRVSEGEELLEGFIN